MIIQFKTLRRCYYLLKNLCYFVAEPIQQLAEMLDVPVATTYLHIMMFIQSIINIPCVFGLRVKLKNMNQRSFSLSVRWFNGASIDFWIFVIFIYLHVYLKGLEHNKYIPSLHYLLVSSLGVAILSLLFIKKITIGYFWIFCNFNTSLSNMHKSVY